MNTFTSHHINPADFRYSGTIQSETQTSTDGIKNDPSWANVETNVRSKKLPPLKSTETKEGKQPIHVQRFSWLIHAHSRAFTAQMRYVVNSQNHYITDIRNYKGLEEYLVLDTELRDNE